MDDYFPLVFMAVVVAVLGTIAALASAGMERKAEFREQCLAAGHQIIGDNCIALNGAVLESH